MGLIGYTEQSFELFKKMNSTRRFIISEKQHDEVFRESMKVHEDSDIGLGGEWIDDELMK